MTYIFVGSVKILADEVQLINKNVIFLVPKSLLGME
jgi:hypothetical protein